MYLIEKAKAVTSQFGRLGDKFDKNIIRDGGSTALSTVYTAYIASTVHTVYIIWTALELKGYYACTSVLGYIDLLVSEQKAEWSVLSVRMDCGFH